MTLRFTTSIALPTHDVLTDQALAGLVGQTPIVTPNAFDSQVGIANSVVVAAEQDENRLLLTIEIEDDAQGLAVARLLAPSADLLGDDDVVEEASGSAGLWYSVGPGGAELIEPDNPTGPRYVKALHAEAVTPPFEDTPR